MAYAMFMALVMTLIAGAIGMYIRYKIWGDENKPKTVVEYGRAWAAYIAFFVPMASIHNFIQQSFAEGLVRFFILIIFYPLIAFGLGCFYGMFKVKSDVQDDVKSSYTNSAIQLSSSNVSEIKTQSSVVSSASSSNLSKEDLLVEVSGVSDWDLAIKYDENLRNDYFKLVSLNKDIAQKFQSDVVDKNLFSDYQNCLTEYINQALELNKKSTEYSKDRLINQVVAIAINQSLVAAKEILEIVRLYKLDEVDDFVEKGKKLFPLLRKIEAEHKISIINILSNLSDKALANEYQIMFGLYNEFIDGNVVYLVLESGNVAVVRKTEYRIYESKKLAEKAIVFYKNTDLWVNEGFVESIKRTAD